jgi:hypothetical protein
MARRPWIICCSLLVCCGVLSAAASQRALAQDERAALLEQMTALAKETTVTVADATQAATLVEKPIFRYSDQPRRFIDATMWAWTEGGRPVAFQKIEAIEYGDTARPAARWQYCLASLSTRNVTVKWTGREFRTKSPGIEFRELEGAPDVAGSAAQRKRQARELTRHFSARIVTDPENNIDQEMRLLTTPLFEYSDPRSKEFLGAVYGLSTNGTNPDLLIVIEARGSEGKLAWHYAPARMTTGGVTLKYQDAKVWDCVSADDRALPLMTWTFFTTPREPLPAGGQP